MEIMFLSLLFTAFNVLTVLCVAAILIAVLTGYGKPKGEKNENRTDIERNKKNPWIFW